MSKKLKATLSVFISFFALWLLLELSIFAFYSVREKKIVPASTLFNSVFYFDSMAASEDCPWGRLIGPHPQLSFYYHNDATCRRPERNNFGLAGADMGFEKNGDFYNVLVLGASVAEGLATNRETQNLMLEEVLNKRWQAPNGKPFHVINGAIAAAQGPFVTVQTLLFSHLADLAISIEGYNEHFGLNAGAMLEAFPGLSTDFAVERSHPLLAWTRREITEWVRSSKWMRASYLHFLLASTLSAELQTRWESAVEQKQPYPPLPAEWSAEKKKVYYLSRYETYLRTTHAIFKLHKIPVVTFIQPAPRFFKSLTFEEERVVGKKFDTSGYRDIFTAMEALPQADVAHESLLKIYEKHSETLYIDHIHTNAIGLHIMAEEISERLGKRFAWTAKHQ